jgi:hypothetical protein
VTAVIVMDPHMAAGDNPGIASDVTTRAKQASIRVQRRNGRSGGALFKVDKLFSLLRGCYLNWTDERFLYTAKKSTTLYDFIPAPVLKEVFEQIGITPHPLTRRPVIVAVDRVACTPDPDNPGPLPNGGDGAPSIPGILSMRVTIEFEVPR